MDRVVGKVVPRMLSPSDPTMRCQYRTAPRMPALCVQSRALARTYRPTASRATADLADQQRLESRFNECPRTRVANAKPLDPLVRPDVHEQCGATGRHMANRRI